MEQKFVLVACFELVQLAPFTQKNRVLPLVSALTHTGLGNERVSIY